MNQLLKILGFVLLLLPGSVLGDFDHSRWDGLLAEHVRVLEGRTATQLDYSGMAAQRPVLKAYLAELAAVPRGTFDSWPLVEQLAFLINAYNAWTVEVVLGEYPRIDSIRDIGFFLSSAWNQDFASLFGEPVTLDEIEHEMIRGWSRYQEPRIHFAVNCAAIGCPALRAEAYTGEKLEAQLDDSTRLFLSDRSRNYYQSGRMHISSIFDWYEEDFEKGWGGIDSVAEFLANYPSELGLDAASAAKLRSGNIPIRHLKYDWGLNDVP
ncbi:MAG: DUF547 domain-containing protein [Pseudohongiellaceae bacterium]